MALLRQIRLLFWRPKEAVSLLTAHGSKGLEFDTVFIGGLVEGIFPYEGVDVEEERRLFYVALTRARKEVFLSGYNGLHTAPSRFLKELYETP